MNTSASNCQQEMNNSDNTNAQDNGAQVSPAFSPEATEGQPVSPEEKKQTPAWVMPTAAAGAGLVLGAGGVLMARLLTPGAKAAVPGQELSLAELMTDGNLTVADSVTDDMTFAEAFAAARTEAGPGSVFTWRGNVYSTYTEAEWNAMTAEEQADYAGHFNWEGADRVYNGSIEETEEIVTIDDEPAVKTIAMGHDDKSGADFAVMNIEGHDAVLIDADADGTMDYAAADLNEDGQITAEEVMDLHQAGMEISTEDVAGLMDTDMPLDA